MRRKRARHWLAQRSVSEKEECRTQLAASDYGREGSVLPRRGGDKREDRNGGTVWIPISPMVFHITKATLCFHRDNTENSPTFNL
jgi:hypothetical protein